MEVVSITFLNAVLATLATIQPVVMAVTVTATATTRTMAPSAAASSRTASPSTRWEASGPAAETSPTARINATVATIAFSLLSAPANNLIMSH